jgi:hypothetical protein
MRAGFDYGRLAAKLREELTTGDPAARKLLKQLFIEALREELTSGDPSTKKLLTDLALSAVLKDSAGAELSDYVKNLDVALSALRTAAGNLKAALVEATIKQPIDVQDHWQESATLLPSAARTASGNTADIDVGRFMCGEICLDVTAVSGTNPTLDVYIEGKDRLSGKYKTLFSQTGITAVGTYWFTITTLAFKYLRVRWVIGGTTPSFTFSVGLEGKS